MAGEEIGMESAGGRISKEAVETGGTANSYESFALKGTEK